MHHIQFLAEFQVFGSFLFKILVLIWFLQCVCVSLDTQQSYYFLADSITVFLVMST